MAIIVLSAVITCLLLSFWEETAFRGEIPYYVSCGKENTGGGMLIYFLPTHTAYTRWQGTQGLDPIHPSISRQMQIQQIIKYQPLL